MDLRKLATGNLQECAALFYNEQLGIKLLAQTSAPLPLEVVFGRPGLEAFSNSEAYNSLGNLHWLGFVDDGLLSQQQDLFDKPADPSDINYLFSKAESGKAYDGLSVFAVELNTERPSRTLLATITRAFNRVSQTMPTVVLFRYGASDKKMLAFAAAQRAAYAQKWRSGEKVGKVSILRDIEGHI